MLPKIGFETEEIKWAVGKKEVSYEMEFYETVQIHF